MKKKWFGLVITLFLITACGAPAPAQPGLETIVVETFQALTAAAPATQTPISGITIAINNISFVIPTGVGNGAQVETLEAIPPSADMPAFAAFPTHNKYLIQGYPLTGTFHMPEIYIYPVAEYVQMNEGVGAIVNNLTAILNSPTQPLPEKLPFLPTFNAAQMFYSNAQVINFQSGSGIRYITQYSQAPIAINNASVFYTFQGLTSDGKYYVAAILPINTPTLAADGNPESVTPAGGIPLDLSNFELLPTYTASVTQMLNATDPNAFNPILPLLDALIQSITLTQ